MFESKFRFYFREDDCILNNTKQFDSISVYSFAKIYHLPKKLTLLMTRFVALFLSLLYLTAFSGATVTVHYCAGSVSAVSLDEGYAKKNCDKCQAKKKSCCQDKQTVLQGNNNHEILLQPFSFEKVKFVLTNEVGYFIQPSQLTSYYLSGLNKFGEKSPPVPLYISLCVYRI